MSEQEVEHCPFCGGSELEFLVSSNGMDGSVNCETCLCQGPVVTVGCRDNVDDIDLEFEAYEAWNKREG